MRAALPRLQSVPLRFCHSCYTLPGVVTLDGPGRSCTFTQDVRRIAVSALCAPCRCRPLHPHRDSCPAQAAKQAFEVEVEEDDEDGPAVVQDAALAAAGRVPPPEAAAPAAAAAAGPGPDKAAPGAPGGSSQSGGGGGGSSGSIAGQVGLIIRRPQGAPSARPTAAKAAPGSAAAAAAPVSAAARAAAAALMAEMNATPSGPAVATGGRGLATDEGLEHDDRHPAAGGGGRGKVSMRHGRLGRRAYAHAPGA